MGTEQLRILRSMLAVLAVTESLADLMTTYSYENNRGPPLQGPTFI